VGHHEHRAKSPASAVVAVLSVSTSRTLNTDKSGHWIAKQAVKEGHRIAAHRIVPDDVEAICNEITQITADPAPDAVIVTGGTGISPGDVTIEALKPLFTKELTAFSPIFSQLSYEQVDSAALLSRATAGTIGDILVFCIPGSLKACQLACKALIFPELGHLLMHTAEL
jgi:molybdenum cofactor biosynthesis protein B